MSGKRDAADEERKTYYQSLTLLQLVELFLEGGFTPHAESLIKNELRRRELDPSVIDESYLNDLLNQSGYRGGVKTFKPKHPFARLVSQLLHFKKLATEHPYIFALLLLLPLYCPELVRGILWVFEKKKQSMPSDRYLYHVIPYIVYFTILWRFGWFKAIGFLSPGRWAGWGVMVLFLVFEFYFSHFFMSEKIEFGFSQRQAYDPDFSLASYVVSLLTYYSVCALIEEVLFRGLMLYCFLRLWGNTRKGMFKSVFISSLLFGLLHISINAFEISLFFILFKVLVTTISGVFYCALLLYGRSFWIPVVSHLLFNFFVSLLERDDETSGVILIIIRLSLIITEGILAVYLIRKCPLRPSVPDTA